MREPLETFLKETAYYGEGELKVTNIPLTLGQLKLIGKGFFSRVYLIQNEAWVMKEGRWDLDFKLAKQLYLPIPARLLQWLIRPLGYNFQPQPEEVIQQYKEYLIFAQYFGYFNSHNYYHPQLDQIHQRQRAIRAEIIKELPQKWFDEFTVQHNFLPKEFLLYGPSITPSQKEKNTSLIFQQYLVGDHMHDIHLKDLGTKEKTQLLLFLHLLLKFNNETGLLPDTRPRYLLTQSYDWFYSTDNILITDGGVYYLDTRWFWPSSYKNPLRRGVIFPELILNSAKRWIDTITRDLK